MSVLDPVSLLKTLPAVIIGLTVHEYAHAWMAFKLGDTTARDMGRLTFNPIKHIDPIGFIFIVLAGFGWAKPVMFNPENLKNKHRDEIWIALAGPLSNLITGIFFFIVARVLVTLDFFNATNIGHYVVNFLITGGLINFGLFVFNLIPIPPLDGSHVYLTFLKVRNPNIFILFNKYGTLALFLLIILENQLKINVLPIMPVIRFFANIVYTLLQFPQ